MATIKITVATLSEIDMEVSDTMLHWLNGNEMPNESLMEINFITQARAAAIATGLNPRKNQTYLTGIDNGDYYTDIPLPTVRSVCNALDGFKEPDWIQL